MKLNPETLIDLRDREVLQEIAESAGLVANTIDNDRWKCAYIDLRNAADRLDAMIARGNAGGG